jgi:glycosyltransferase involved in cell wall biosynthesis
MRIAIVHEWLVTYAGSEKVLEVMLSMFPHADVFCLVDVMPECSRAWLKGHRVRTSYLQGFPGVQHYHRKLLPLMPFAVEQLDVSGYDVVISNSHAVAKGVITGADQLHICYCYTPMRYAWDLQVQYLNESNLNAGVKSLLARWMLHKCRIWDSRTADGVDHFVACSNYIARRILKTYRRDSTVIYPGVAVEDFHLCDAKRDYYVTCSRIVPYKKINLIVEAFRKMPDRKLVVIGDGPQFGQLETLATPNVKLLGAQPHEVLHSYLQGARAFIFAAEEDFGIAPLEAQACGTPVLAYGKGGACETVIDGVTGYHFSEQTADSICAAVKRFERTPHLLDPHSIRAHALKFSEDRFRQEFGKLVESQYELHQRMIAKGGYGHSHRHPIFASSDGVRRMSEHTS